MKSKVLYKVAIASGTATTIAGTVLLLLYVGSLLDKHFGTAPWLTMIGGFMGFIGSITLLLRLLKSMK